jgi:F-type H+-transporting ATPase subunit gamma
MKMVSAAKLRRAQDAIVRMRPYAEKLQQILSNVSASLDSSEGKYSQQREVKKVLLVAIVSNRGLAGAFNTQVFRQIRRKAASELESEGKKYTCCPWARRRWMPIAARQVLQPESCPPMLPASMRA